MEIVLVDPNRNALKYIARLLEARNHEVRAFTDGKEALAYTKSVPTVGAVITSSELDSMSGVELCWEVRLLAEKHRPIYIIMMFERFAPRSANQDPHKLIEALDCGADDFIGKPPVAEELYARLRAAERMTTMQRELAHLAATDPLTGILNRRAFFEKGVEACERAAAGGKLFAFALDIDHFKNINDVYGHHTGDKVICAVTREAESECAIVGRLGGEEFATLVEGGDLSEARATAERVRSKVENLCFETPKGTFTLTCSLGVSEWASGDSIDGMLRRADIALYAAKNGGRNRVVIADPDVRAMEGGQQRTIVGIRSRYRTSSPESVD